LCFDGNIAQAMMILIGNKPRIRIGIEGYAKWQEWYQFINRENYCISKRNQSFYEIHINCSKDNTLKVIQNLDFNSFIWKFLEYFNKTLN
jgi:hypothetical protein